MDLEDLFEQRKRSYNGGIDEGYHKHDRQKEYKSYQGYFDPWSLIDKIRSDKKFKAMATIVIILAVVIVITLIVLLLPLIGKIIGFISENGISGLLDAVLESLNRIWSGSGMEPTEI